MYSYQKAVVLICNHSIKGGMDTCIWCLISKFNCSALSKPWYYWIYLQMLGWIGIHLILEC